MDGSGYLDFGEVSVALADMGALDGVLASKAGELFEMFDVDGDGRVDVDEFEELTAKVKALRGSVDAKPTPEVPAGFAESAGALPLRKSFEAFAAFGKGHLRSGESVEHVNGRDWAKLVKDCGLIGGPVNAPAADIIFARACNRGQRVLRWEDGSFLAALASVAAEHRVTFGQVAQRVAQCAPAVAASASVRDAAEVGGSERAAAAAARAAAESANGAPPGADAMNSAALRSIFAQYSRAAGGDGAGAVPLDALHALADVGALRMVSPEQCQAAITAAITQSVGSGCPDGQVSLEAFQDAARRLVAHRRRATGTAAYKAPEEVRMHLDQRRALRASFEQFAGSKHGMKPAEWEVTVRACGLIGAKCAEATAAVIFAKCKQGAGAKSMAPKVMSFDGFAQALAHVGVEYGVKFDVVAQRVVKCTPPAAATAAGAEKDAKDAAGSAPGSPERANKNAAAAAAAGGSPRSPAKKSPAPSAKARPPSPARSNQGGNQAGAAELAAPAASNAAAASAGGASPGRGSLGSRPPSPSGSTRSSVSGASSVRPPLAPAREIPPELRADKALMDAFATFADDAGAEGDASDPSCDNVKWGRIVRGCGLVGGSLTDATAQEIYRQSGVAAASDGKMRFEEFLQACAVTAGTHGVAFKEVATRVVSVAQKQRARLDEEKRKADAAKAAEAAAKPTKPGDAKKKKKKGLFGGIF